VKRLLLLACLATTSAACAQVQTMHAARKAALRKHCGDEEQDGPLTLAATPDTAPYGADPLKSFTCGAPPR
jgi:hypothetical protein